MLFGDSNVSCWQPVLKDLNPNWDGDVKLFEPIEKVRHHKYFFQGHSQTT